MVNINILNKLIQQISEQIPLVNSYYTESPYTSWNVKEVKYGSVLFSVNKVITRDATTRYETTVYYGDRLTENGSNRDSIWSDAATVIQTIVGALNQTDSELLTVSYPISITLFEQDFADSLAGGYATMTIETQGMGECFEDELTVPEIVGTSAYYTKDEILELFPTKVDYSNLIDTVSDMIGNLAAETNQKLNVGYFDEFRKQIEAELEDRPTGQEYNEFVNSVVDATASLSKTLNDKVGISYFDNWADDIEKELENRPTSQDYNELQNAVTDMTGRLAAEIAGKVGLIAFDEFADRMESELNDRPTGQDHNNVLNDIAVIKADLETRPTAQDHDAIVQAVIHNNDIISKELLNRVNINTFDEFADRMEAELEDRPTGQEYNGLLNEVNDISKDLETRPTVQNLNELQNAVTDMTSRLAAEISGKVGLIAFDEFADMVEKELGQRPTQAQMDEIINAVLKNNDIITGELINRVGLHEFNVFVSETEAKLNERITQSQFDELIVATETVTKTLAAALDNKLDDSYFETWRAGLERTLNDKLDRRYFDQYAENVYTKTEVHDLIFNYRDMLYSYLSSEEFMTYLTEYVKNVVVAFTENYLNGRLDYYTKTEIDTLLKNLSLDSYYSKTESDGRYYTKTEVDTTVSAIYATIGDIDTILNNVLYEL